MGMNMKWTADKIEEMFTAMSNGKSPSEVGAMLGCTRNAVIGKWNRERIKRGLIPPPPCETRPRPQRPRTILDAVEGQRINPQLLRNTTPKRACEPTRRIPEVAKVPLGLILPALPVPVPKPARASQIGILDVTGCRWPVSEHPDVIAGKCFCNAPQRDGSSYCATHAAASVSETSRDMIRKTIRSAIYIHKRGRAA